MRYAAEAITAVLMLTTCGGGEAPVSPMTQPIASEAINHSLQNPPAEEKVK